MFQKRHYEAIANVIVKARDKRITNKSYGETIEAELIDLFTTDNTYFNVDKFLKACDK